MNRSIGEEYDGATEPLPQTSRPSRGRDMTRTRRKRRRNRTSSSSLSSPPTKPSSSSDDSSWSRPRRPSLKKRRSHATTHDKIRKSAKKYKKQTQKHPHRIHGTTSGNHEIPGTGQHEHTGHRNTQTPSSRALRRLMNRDIANSLSNSSFTQYTKYWTEYKSFYYSRFDKHVKYSTPEQVQMFITYLKYYKRYVTSTLRCYLSGIAFYSKSQYHRDPTKSHAMKLLLRSYKKGELENIDNRKPVDTTMLSLLTTNALASNIDVYDRYAFSIMYNFMFHAALRVSEICQSGTSKHILQFKNVQFDQAKSVVLLKLTSYKHSNGAAASIAVPCSTHLKKMLTKYISMRGNQTGPFICHKDSKPFTRLELVTQLKKQLTQLHYNERHYNTHSFRIGKATEMSKNGASDGEISTFGRWRTSAFKKYLRPSILYS